MRTIIAIAAAYGKDELDLPRATLVGCILLIQFLGLPRPSAYIRLAAPAGHPRVDPHAGLVVYMGVVVYAMQIETALGVLDPRRARGPRPGRHAGDEPLALTAR